MKEENCACEECWSAECASRVGGFSSNAQAAITQNPNYFVWWYTIKSVALCASLMALAFFVGRGSRR